jgi:hypothetical protein
MANTSRRRRRTSGVEHDRQHEPGRQQQAGQRRAEELVGHDLGRVHLAVGLLEVGSSTIAGMERLGAVVVEHLARPEQQRRHEDREVQEPLGADDLLDVVGRGRRRGARARPAPPRREHEPIALAPTISRRRSLRSVITPPAA